METGILCKVRVQRDHQDHFGQEETVSPPRLLTLQNMILMAVIILESLVWCCQPFDCRKDTWYLFLIFACSQSPEMSPFSALLMDSKKRPW